MFYTILSYPLFLTPLEPEPLARATGFAPALEGPSSHRSSWQPKVRDEDLSDFVQPDPHLKGSHCHVPIEINGIAQLTISLTLTGCS